MKDRIRLAGPALAAVLGWALLCTLSVVGAAGPAQDQAAAPFRNEDVVRMLVAGRPTAEIIAAINTAVVSFDLSDEQVEELRMAAAWMLIRVCA